MATLCNSGTHLVHAYAPAILARQTRHMGKTAKCLKRPSRRQNELKKANSQSAQFRAQQDLSKAQSPLSKTQDGGVAKPKSTKKSRGGTTSFANKLKQRKDLIGENSVMMVDDDDDDSNAGRGLAAALAVVDAGSGKRSSKKLKKKQGKSSADYLKFFK